MADGRQAVCLSKTGDLDIVNYAGKKRSVVSSGSLKTEFFTAEKPFEVDNHEAVSVTGCTQYLAVAKHEVSSSTNAVALLDRKGRFMSMASDCGIFQSYNRRNPIHRMEFCVWSRCVFLVAQNLKSAVSLYAVNSKRTAV